MAHTHSTARVGGQELQRSSIRSSSSHDDSVLHGIGIRQPLDDLGNSRSLLTDSDVDTVQLFLLIGSVIEALLVDDRINGNGGFAVILIQSFQNCIAKLELCLFLPSLTITNDQLSLTTANGDQRIDGLNASLHRLAHRNARDDTRSLDTDTGAKRVNRV